MRGSLWGTVDDSMFFSEDQGQGQKTNRGILGEFTEVGSRGLLFSPFSV